MSTKVHITDKQKKIKLPTGTRLLIRKACAATLAEESFKDSAEINVTIVDDDEIRAIIAKCYERCRSILTEHIDKLHFVAEFLLKNEFMDDEQFKACMEMDNPTFEEIENIAEQRKRKSEEENKSAHANNRRQEELERERDALAREALEENKEKGVPDFFTSSLEVEESAAEAEETEVEEDVDSSTDADNSEENGENK